MSADAVDVLIVDGSLPEADPAALPAAPPALGVGSDAANRIVAERRDSEGTS